MKTLLFLLCFFVATTNLYAQKYDYDASGNRIQRAGVQDTCDCDCPDELELQSWLTFTVTPDDSCFVRGCKISAVFDIPPEFDCYNKFRVQPEEVFYCVLSLQMVFP
jgi:hypothetical protein